MVALEADCEQEFDAAEAKRQRKLAKREAAQAQLVKENRRKKATVEELDAEALEAKRQRKAAKRAAAELETLPETTEDTKPKKNKKKKNMEISAEVEKETTGPPQEVEPDTKEEGKEQRYEASGQQNKLLGKSKQAKEFEIFVDGLHASATDEDVRQHFSCCGAIVGFSLPRGRDGNHRGKAFVEFESKEACEKAIQMNNTLFKLRLLVVRMATDRISTPRANDDVDKWRKDLEVVVGGLPFSMTEDSVRKQFAGCGKIVALRMPPHLKKKGVAFIAFSNKDACKEALSMHGSICEGRPLYVHKSGNNASSKSELGPAISDVKKDNIEKEFEVFVGGLPFSTKEKVLRTDFSECGELKAFRMVVNSDGSCKGSAFLEYTSKAACEKALAYDGTEYGGRVIRVRMASDNSHQQEKGKGKGKGKGKSKPHEGKSGKGNKEFEIVVTGLPFSTTSEVLRKDFEECGEVLRLVLPLTDEGHAKGNAYIEFANKEACEKALAYHETSYGGRWIRVRMSNDRASGDGASGKTGKNTDAPGSTSKGNIVTFDSDDE